MSGSDAVMPHDRSTHGRPTQAVVLVTGGSGVIGGAVCRRFGFAGCAVAIQYWRHAQRAARIAQDIQTSGGQAMTLSADLRNRASVSRMVHAVLERFGRLDIAICAAGQAASRLLLRTTLESWQNLLAVNLTGTFFTLQALTPHFRERRDGTAIVIGSLSGQLGGSGQVAYSASKAGLLGLMRSVAKEWGPFHARINAVFPGWHESPLTTDQMSQVVHYRDHVLNRTPRLEEIVESIYHLAWMKDISGQVWNLDSRIW